ncbi:DnaJ-domain-containing protein [Aspergillus steynii IBT 23096]|uniref:DnaJ-domain-containing protein n=1 Tax=Aspergillus steynii IBT 23096 TaxID=1392250 RepID=A0A2I2G1T0_9EURO|nr:DnaJ-domain-containing protein [Aspergillus steynii IBT 23096]PLB46835.1 DnaJ-domain-containing protein [Aspergillus steynii IBT 23096]
MSSAPDIDPYAVLGVQKDATLPEIKTAHRKLVLKCHPDKIKDESLRSKAQDQFQKVQQAYELLSDDARRTKYDQKVRIAELKREMMARGGMPYSSPRASSSAREYRDGRIYEERAPAEPFDDEIPFTEEPRTTSRKFEEFGKRRSAKPTEEKKKTKSVPVSNVRAAKDTARDSAKATHSNRAKSRTKERRREVYEKSHERVYGDSDDDGASDSSASSVYVRVKRPSESRRSREPSSRNPKPTESARRSSPRYEEDNYAGEWESKHKTAKDYILRSKGRAPVETDARHRSSRSPLRHRDYESAEPESSSSRRSGRSARSSKETVRGSSRHGSYEHLEPQARPYEQKVPSVPTAATAPGVKTSSSSRPSLYPSRSATTHSHPRLKREGTSRSEQVLLGMAYPDGPPRTSKLRSGDRYDSGYSSPGTPEMPNGESPSKSSSTRYKIVTEPDTVVVEPSMPSPPHPSPKRAQTYSPPRQERPVRPTPKPVRSSTTYSYKPDASNRYESTRPSTSRQPSSRHLFGEVEYGARGKNDMKYAREVGPEHSKYPTRDARDSRDSRDAYSRHVYDDYRNPPMGRRQSTYA